MRLKPHKYGAQATVVDGVRFHSKREAQRYRELKLLEKAGEIHDVRLQPRFELAAFRSVERLGVVIGCYVADFSYCQCLRTPCARSAVVVEDAKGFKTPLYRWKKRHVEAQYGIEISEV